MPVTVRDVVAAVESLYPPSLAEPWDAVGLVCGDPGADATGILLTVDVTDDVVDQAIGLGVTMIIAHHPLLLTPVHGVAATTAKGRIVHRLITAGIALMVAHTNADSSIPGVSDALAAALGISGLEPLDPRGEGVGIGRIGTVPPVTLAEFAARVRDALPATAAGIRAAGDPARVIRRVAVCGGSGDSLLAAATAAGADAYVTSDLRHHRVQEHLADDGCALIDVAHWAGEWPWLRDAAALLAERLGTTVEVHVSGIVTDPWSLHL